MKVRGRVRLPTEDEWDAWQDRHPRADRMITRAYGVKLRVQWAVPQWRERRRWTPGMFYLDHGSLPCVLVRLYDGDCLEGVSMVDGALVGGCSIYACGPEPVDRKGALRLAEELREEREERAERAEQEEQTDLLGEVVEYLNAKADHAEGRVPGSYADGMRNAAVDVGLWSAIRGRWRDGSTAAPGTDEG